jgi:hypothetical protein
MRRGFPDLLLASLSRFQASFDCFLIEGVFLKKGFGQSNDLLPNIGTADEGIGL